MNLSKHFTLEELTLSSDAKRRGLDNTPGPEQLKNLGILAVKLEEARAILGNKPILISSGYRSPDVNFAVKGSKNSEHMQGFAADFICPDFGTPYEICQKLANSNMMFNQLIHEYGDWVHLGVGPANRKELLTICKPNLGYRRGIFTC